MAQMKKLQIKKAQLSEIHKANKDFAKAIVSNPQVQVIVASAAGGTIALGCCGAAVGGVVGIPFALFTFGLSIPISATVGAVAAGAAGGATGATAGFTAFAWRKEIAKLGSAVWSRVKDTSSRTKAAVMVKVIDPTQTQIAVQYKNIATLLTAGKNKVATKCSELFRSGVEAAKQPQAQVTAASATVGGVAFGAGGGALGLATGGIAGAAVGVLPAVFTFGLSIPIGAMIGGSAGLCIGTTVGGATGALGGGAVGYGVYGKRVEIQSGTNKCISYVKQTIGSLRPATSVPKVVESSKTGCR